MRSEYVTLFLLHGNIVGWACLSVTLYIHIASSIRLF